MPSARLLLADDDSTFREATAALLRREGFHCDVAADATQAAGALESNDYDALITDIHMPGSSDLAYLQQAAREGRLPPVIVVTAYPALSTAMQAIRLSVLDYLPKPFDFDELKERVAQAVARRRDGERGQAVAVQLERLASMLRGEEDSEPRKEAAAERQPVSEGLPVHTLSPREREVLGALEQGYRIPEIAEVLSLSAHTVRNHMKSIFRKLGVHSQVELLAELRHDQRSR